MSLLEIVAALFGAVSVYLSARQRIASWPTAIVNVLLSAVVYYRARPVLGHRAPVRLLRAERVRLVRVEVRRREPHRAARDAHAARAGAAARRRSSRVGRGRARPRHHALHRRARAQPGWVPWTDATLTAASLVAQWMMTRKLLGNWLVWIAVDVVYVPLLAYKGLYAFAILYAVFLGLAVKGYVDWRRDLRGRAAGVDAPALAA
jgi:nicotinamide mononucleotide transporter